ncbi:hypothetical protein C1A38_10610 [Verrucosispora sp. ts21]|nr:hypothetical protein C1A38_10610 [Verrucosispora sp. ts21]
MTSSHDRSSGWIGSSGLADLLRGHRRAAGLTQAELATRAGVGVRTVRDLERGRSSRPQRTTVNLLADALDLSGAARTAFVAAARKADGGTSRAIVGSPAPVPPPPELIGRERDLAELVTLLTEPRGPRVISLVGVAGVGKTALALAACHAVAAARRASPVGPSPESGRPGGVSGLHVGAGSDVADVLAAALGAFGVSRTTELTARIGDPTLLVDAAERAPDSVAGAVQRLVDAVPTLRVLVTGRHPVGLPDEWVRPVSPLDVPPPGDIEPSALAASPAVALFTARLAQVRREPPTEAERPALAALVRRLGGLPLAIELMAARGRLLSLSELLDRYGDRVLDLDIAARSGWPTGQLRPDDTRAAVAGTLRDAVATSYRLLDDEERAALRRFSAFDNRWSIELAEEMLAGTAITADPVRLLNRFIELGLLHVREDGPFRFRLLDAVRDYAVERVSSAGESAVIQRRHARVITWFVERTAPSLAGADATGAARRLDEVSGDISAALAYAAVDDPMTALRLAAGLPLWWRLRGRAGAGRQWLLRLLADPRTAEADGELRLRASHGAASLAGEQAVVVEELPRARDRTRQRGVVARARKPPVATPRSSPAPAPPVAPPVIRD